MPLVDASGLTFHVQLLGAAGARPPVVMLHGLLVGSLAAWYFGAAGRLARGGRVLLYDLRGHGRSARAPSGYGSESMAGDLEALLDGQLGDGPVTLVGHSWGALVALRFALRHPGRVARLALVEAPLPPSRALELEAFTRLSPEELVRALPGPLQEAVGREGRAARTLVERLRFLAQETTLLADVAGDPDVADEVLAAVTCPVLLVYGDRSSCRPVGDRLARVMPGARLEVLRGGHFLPSEAPGPLADVLEAFCDG